MSILSLPVTPVAAPAAKPGGAPVANGASTDSAPQGSFPAVLAKANQQGSASKSSPAGKEPSGDGKALSSNGEIKGDLDNGVAGTDGVQTPLLSPFLPTPTTVPLPVENILVSALASHVTGNSATELSPLIGVSGEVSKLTTGKTEGLGVSLLSPSLSPVSAPNVGLQGEVGLDSIHRIPVLTKPVEHAIPQFAALPTVGEKVASTPPLLRESVGPVPLASQVSVANVPLSFVNGASSQGPIVGGLLNQTELSSTIPQNIQSTLSPLGTPATIGNDSQTSGSISLVGKSEGETGGSSLAFDQRGHQENGAALSQRQQFAGQTFGGSSFGESGPEFRVAESSAGVRPESLAERSRAMNVLTQQRMQLDVMLTDETKVQVDVMVKQQAVTAQLMTDHVMLRNLALQHEPLLDAQLSSAGLELKQFGAEVSEQGLFGQHLSDSSEQHSSHPSNVEGPDDSIMSQGSNLLGGAGLEADGRLHFVA